MSYRRAYTYASLRPYLAKPISLIKLKYLTRPILSEQKQMILPSPCEFCGRTWGGVGSWANDGKAVICEKCAIENFQYNEGFTTRVAAAAYRRRLFDVGYLWTEMLVDKYIALHELGGYDDITQAVLEDINDLATHILNASTNPAQKVRLQNTSDQAAIERSLRKLLTLEVVELLRSK